MKITHAMAILRCARFCHENRYHINREDYIKLFADDRYWHEVLTQAVRKVCNDHLTCDDYNDVPVVMAIRKELSI